MPVLNRRRFLQVASAAGLVPAMPALPAAAPATSAYTSAQLMWAKLYAQAGNAPNVQGLARALGVAPDVAKGLYATLSQTKVVATPLLGHTCKPVVHKLAAKAASFDPAKVMAIITRDIDRQYLQPVSR